VKRVLAVIAVICGLVLATGILLPFFGKTAARGPFTKNLSNAKQLGTGVYLFAMDHEGRFPMHLSEVFPDYIPAEAWRELLYRPARPSEEQPDSASRYDWLYFGAFFDEQHPPTILIAAPQAFTEKGKSRRILVYGDGIGAVEADDVCQRKLRQTIKELNERAAVLMPKRENSAPQIDQPTVP
jgi:hypothetical protein